MIPQSGGFGNNGSPKQLRLPPSRKQPSPHACHAPEIGLQSYASLLRHKALGGSILRLQAVGFHIPDSEEYSRKNRSIIAREPPGFLLSRAITPPDAFAALYRKDFVKKITAVCRKKDKNVLTQRIILDKIRKEIISIPILAAKAVEINNDFIRG